MKEDAVSFIREFTVDFFGSFLPGALMLLGIFVGVIYPLTRVCESQCGSTRWLVCSVSRQLCDLVALSGTTPGIFAVIGLAYLIGLSYSKRSVSWADSASYYYNNRGDRRLQRDSPVVVDRPEPPKWSLWRLFFSPVDATNTSEQSLWFRFCDYLHFKLGVAWWFAFSIAPSGYQVIQFPYNDLRGYLCRSGLHATAAHVHWKLDRPDQHYNPLEWHESRWRREGMDVDRFNVLKMRIQIAFPSEYHAIAYLEGQNRLLASTYYVATQLWLIMWLAFGTFSVAHFAVPGWHRAIWLFPLGTALLFCLLQHRILEVLHKERVREAIRVVDAAAVLGVYDLGKDGEEKVPTLGNIRQSTPTAP